MSSPDRLPVRLSPRAEEDLVDILAWTRTRWGDAQVDVYAEKIRKALSTIAANFALGHARDDLPATHRAYLVGAHVIVYRVLPGEARARTIGIVRVLHQRMIPGRRV